MNRLSRSTALKTAAVFSSLLSLANLVITLPIIMQGSAAVGQAPNSPPYFIELALFVTSIVGLVAAFGAWRQMRWGVLLTIVVNAINLLSAAPGILFAPRPWGLAASGVTILLSVMVIVLCLWPARRSQTVYVS